MEIISRGDAHKLGRRQFYTGKLCKNGHQAPRFVSNGGCVSCQNFRIIPALAAPNTGMPPTPYIFPVDTEVTPELVSFVHSRVLQDMVGRAAADFARLLPLTKVHKHQDPAEVANAVMHTYNDERKATRAALLAAGWSEAQLDLATRAVL